MLPGHRISPQTQELSYWQPLASAEAAGRGSRGQVAATALLFPLSPDGSSPHINTRFGQVTGQTGEMEVLLSAAHQPAYDGSNHFGDYLEDIYSFIYSAYRKVFNKKEVGMDEVFGP